MCLPDCVAQLAEASSRRALLRAGLGAAICATAVSAPARADDETTKAPTQRSWQRVVNLTHTLSADFPSPFPKPLEMERVSTLGRDRWNIFRWRLIEHVGTHLDAPLHC